MSGISLHSIDTEDTFNHDWEYNQDKDFLGRDSFSFIQHKNYNLKFLKKIEQSDPRPRIPAKFWEIQSYLRSFFCTSMRKQLFFQSVFDLNFNMHIWLILLNVFFVIIPNAYMILFLSQYSAENHLYVAKMFPLFWGASLQNIMTGIFELVFYSDIVTLVLDYAVLGILHRSPWNKCPFVAYEYEGKAVQCHELQDFYYLTNLNGTTFHYAYYKINESYFQSAEVLYFQLRELEKEEEHIKRPGLFTFYYCFIWVAALFFNNQLYKKYIWRIIDCLIWTLSGIYLLSMLYIYIAFIKENLAPIHRTEIIIYQGYNAMSFLADLAVMLNSPALHMIMARSVHETRPGWDSTAFGISIFVFTVFQELTYKKLLMYCESKAGILIQNSPENSYPLFYLWPIFFRSFSLGPFYTKFIFVTIFFLEFVTIMITFQCLVEVLTSRFTSRKWLTTTLIFLSGIILRFTTNTEIRMLLYVYGKVITIITELFTIHMLYPIGRLLEDIKFYNYDRGIPTIRIFTLKLLFVIYVGLVSFVPIIFRFYWIWAVFLLPLVFGAVFITIKNTCLQKKGFKSLIRPDPHWGPQEHLVRQFRKKFDSREFIDSLGPRFLNRHMLKKSEPATYRLGLQYETRRRTTGAMHKILRVQEPDPKDIRSN